MSKQISSRQWPADLPGVTTAWLARANGVSQRTVRWRRTQLSTPTEQMPDIDFEVGLQMARMRPAGAHLCLWTRLAIAERVGAGATYRQVAKEFGVCIATVQRAVRKGGQGYDPLGGKRTLSSSQIGNLKISRPVFAGGS